MKKRMDLENKYGLYGSYYHFFEDFTGENGGKYESDAQTPKAFGFPENK